MRILLIFFAAMPFALFAQTGTCANPFEAPASPGHEIAMHIRSGDVTIVGSETPVIRVVCKLGRSETAKDVKISFAAGNLSIRGGPDGNAHFRIEIPKTADVVVRASAGDLSLSGLTANIDAQLRAGDLTIITGKPSDYRHAEASVLAGDLNAAAFGVSKGGLFRSFTKGNPAGRYSLRAEVLAGDLILK